MDAQGLTVEKHAPFLISQRLDSRLSCKPFVEELSFSEGVVASLISFVTYIQLKLQTFLKQLRRLFKNILHFKNST